MAIQELERPSSGDDRRPLAAPPRARTLPAGRVAIVGGVALALAALLNSATLLELAESQPEGSRVRGVALAVAEPLHDVADALGLTRPREVLDGWMGRDTGEPATVVAAGPATVASPAATPGPTSAAPATSAAASATTAVPSTAASSTAAPTTPAPTTVAPTTTAALGAGPVSVLIAGDSMSQGLGVMFEPIATEAGGYEVESIGKASTGITRPDYFDWPARLREVTAASDPDVVVLMFGGNDGQPIQLADGSYAQVSEPAWAAEYGRRVGGVMDQLGREGRRVVWSGTPNSSSANFNKRLTVINQVLRQQSAARPWVTYVDAWSLFAGPDGSYVASLPDGNGKVKKMRNKDGYHLTIEGYKRLARAVFGDVEQLRKGG
jgi:hypothetical protein